MIKTRNGRIITSNEKQNKLLKKIYGTVIGRRFLKFLTKPTISHIVGRFMDSKMSKPLIKRFIKTSKIDLSQYIMYDFLSYNDFFTRKIKPEMRPVDHEPSHLISPCDSKLSIYKIDRNSIFRIKGTRYRISDLLHNKVLADHFCGGYCCIFRLEVDDYHRYCYIDNGTKTRNVFIEGELHTVNPIALEKYNIYKRNCREYTMMRTENFGNVVQVEVGAMMVGRIVNYDHSGTIHRGIEKGMFEFGGSTIVMLFEKDKVKFDDDILENSSDGIETVVKYGEKIGIAAE